MKKLTIVMMLVMLLLVPVSCTSTLPESEEEQVAESWQIGEYFMYSAQAIWGDTLVGVEYIFGDGLETQYISTYNLRTREKQRVMEIDPESFRVSPPSIYEDRVVWSSANISGRQLGAINYRELNWDVFLFDIETGEVHQVTVEEHAQMDPMIYGDTIVWLDNRHESQEYHNPRRFDVYAFDLKTNTEKRLTSAPTVEEDNLSISDNLVVWADNRHANPDVKIHAGNEPDYNNEIYVYDLNTNREQRITNNTQNDQHPFISGNRIVWLRQFTYLEADIFSYVIGSLLETQVSRSRFASGYPSFYEDKIVWTDARVSKGNTSNDVVMNGQPGTTDIYLFDLKTGQEARLVSGHVEETNNWAVLDSVVVHSDFVVYVDARMAGPITYALRLK